MTGWTRRSLSRRSSPCTTSDLAFVLQLPQCYNPLYGEKPGFFIRFAKGSCLGQAVRNADAKRAEKWLIALIFFPFDVAQDRLALHLPLRAVQGSAKTCHFDSPSAMLRMQLSALPERP